MSFLTPRQWAPINASNYFTAPLIGYVLRRFLTCSSTPACNSLRSVTSQGASEIVTDGALHLLSARYNGSKDNVSGEVTQSNCCIFRRIPIGDI
jgi:hypothetical protein